MTNGTSTNIVHVTFNTVNSNGPQHEQTIPPGKKHAARCRRSFANPFQTVKPHHVHQHCPDGSALRSGAQIATVFIKLFIQLTRSINLRPGDDPRVLPTLYRPAASSTSFHHHHHHHHHSISRKDTRASMPEAYLEVSWGTETTQYPTQPPIICQWTWWLRKVRPHNHTVAH